MQFYFVVRKIIYNFVDSKGCLTHRLRLHPLNLMRLVPSKGEFMNITVNKKVHTFEGDTMALVSVLDACDLPQKGIAVAINNKVVRKADWPVTFVNDGDSVTVIQAVCGG